MSARKCGLCSREMVSMNVTSPGDTVVIVAFCRVCDRRCCTNCGHHEQNVYASVCSKCKDVF